MKIYLATSWKNEQQPWILAVLRRAGYSVYDFRNPKEGVTGFSWQQCGGEAANDHARSIPSYLEAINSPRAVEGYRLDKDALDWCEVGVLLLPCGRSAHLEAGYLIGQGKPVVIYLHPTNFEPELMYKLAGDELVHNELDLIIRLHAIERRLDL